MNACCNQGGKCRPAAGRKLRGAFAWILPGAGLALVPKCPACLAAYVALWSGLGMSLTTATYLRAAMLAICLASLLYLAARRVARAARW